MTTQDKQHTTHGAFIIRHKADDRAMYIEFDAEPDKAGKQIGELICSHSDRQLVKLHSLMFINPKEGVDAHAFAPRICNRAINEDKAVACYLPPAFAKHTRRREYAYIIDLDRGLLDFYVGFRTVDRNVKEYVSVKYVAETGEIFRPDKKLLTVPLSFVRKGGSGWLAARLQLADSLLELTDEPDALEEPLEPKRENKKEKEAKKIYEEMLEVRLLLEKAVNTAAGSMPHLEDTKELFEKAKEKLDAVVRKLRDIEKE